MSSLIENKFIPEKYNALTRLDDSQMFGYDYSKDCVIRSISNTPLMSNPRLGNFIDAVQKMASYLIDSGYSIRNFHDITVDENYTKHTT